MATSKENCRDVIFRYLVSQNRPYSANDIVQNLHNKHNRTAVQKALDELTSENQIREKIYGKQKVYSYVHTKENGSSESGLEIAQLDAKIEAATSKLKELERQLKETETELSAFESQPTTENALQQIKDLEETIEKLNQQVQDLSEPKEVITEEEKNKLVKVHDEISREYKKRKKICRNIINSILENYPKKMKVLIEEIGIEMDNDDNAF